MGKDQTIIRVHKRENPFVMVDKYAVNDPGLSWKAKGLLVYLLSKPDDWVIMLPDLIKHATDGRDSVKAGLRELERAGYLARKQIRDENGKFGHTEFVIYERPVLENTELSPQTENPSTVKSTVNGKSVDGKSVSGKTVNGKTVDGKSATTNNELNKNELTKKESTKNEVSQSTPQSKIESKSILRVIERKGLTDRLAEIESVYLVVKEDPRYSDTLFAKTLTKAAKQSIDVDFDDYLLVAMSNNMNDVKQPPATGSLLADKLPESVQRQIEREKEIERQKAEGTYVEEPTERRTVMDIPELREMLMSLKRQRRQ